MRHTKHSRIVALLLAMMLFVSTLSPAAFAEATASPEVPVQPTAEVSVDPTMEPTEEPVFGKRPIITRKDKSLQSL